jgi:hypothetical protein
MQLAFLQRTITEAYLTKKPLQHPLQLAGFDGVMSFEDVAVVAVNGYFVAGLEQPAIDGTFLQDVVYDHIHAVYYTGFTQPDCGNGSV